MSYGMIFGNATEMNTLGNGNQSASTSDNTTVTYQDSGFTPQSITIKKGTLVTFVNKSRSPLWLDSNPHPSNTDYPEFDTFRVRDRFPEMGENFQFEFSKTGTWKFHNHTASGDGTDTTVHPGTIIVVN